MGIFHAFLRDPEVELFGAEGGGENRPGRTAASLSEGTDGVLHGARSFILQDDQGQIQGTHSIISTIRF